MNKLKVLTVVGTRPEIIRLSRVINELDQSEAITHVLVHTGQNYDYELNEILFKDLDLRQPDYILNAAGQNAAITIGNVINSIDPILEKENPDASLVLGDTNSCLCTIPAKKRKIPVFHMEAGNRCFDQRVPEEINRKIVDHISDINMPYSSIGREYLLREGLPGDRIIKTGSPMYEVLTHFMNKIRQSTILSKLGLNAGQYFVVSAHREENISSDIPFNKLTDVLNMIASTYKVPIIVSTHPRTQIKIDKSGNKYHELIRFLKPMSFSDYNNLQLNAKCVLSDSGTISEESSILNFPALNLREAHERPEAMEEATTIMTGFDVARVLQGITVLENKPEKSRFSELVEDYKKPNVSQKVLRIILSYTNYVNRVVWYK